MYLAKTTTPLASMPTAAMAGAMLPRPAPSIAAAWGGVVLTVPVASPLLSCPLRPVDFTLDRSVDVVVVRPRSLFRRRRGCRPLGQVRVLFHPDQAPSVTNTSETNVWRTVRVSTITFFFPHAPASRVCGTWFSLQARIETRERWQMQARTVG